MITGDNPAILSPNYIDAFGIFTVSNNASEIAKIFDRDSVSQYFTTAAGSLETVEHEFKEGGFVVTRTFDTLLMLNHNLKKWKMQYWDGAAWQDIGNATFLLDNQANTIVQFTQVSATKVRLFIEEAQSGTEFSVGEWIVSRETYQFETGFFEYEEEHDELNLQYKLAENTLEKAKVSWTQNRALKYAARARVIFVTEAMRDSLKTIKDTGVPFLWYPEPEARPTRIFFVHWLSKWRERYSSPVKSQGFTIPITVREV